MTHSHVAGGAALASSARKASFVKTMGAVVPETVLVLLMCVPYNCGEPYLERLPGAVGVGPHAQMAVWPLAKTEDCWSP